MIKPDVIVSWPNSCDYPLWREMLRLHRHRFNEVIIVFTETNMPPDFRQFIRSAMQKDYVMFIDSPPIKPNEDWRNVAVNQALIHSYNAEWVWFTEQDFLVGDFYFGVIEDMSTKFDAFSVFQEERMHPCSLYLKRSVLDQLKKDFSAKPPLYDHFGAIQKQLKEKAINVGIIPPLVYNHLNGLTHNWRLISDGVNPNYQEEAFNTWLNFSMNADVEKDPRWVSVVMDYWKRTTPETGN